MRHMKTFGAALLLAALLAGAGLAEDAAPPKFYKLDFVVKEVEGAKVVNARSYSITTANDKGCTIRTGSKVPYQTSGAMPSLYSFLDVGVSIDCHQIREVAGGLSLDVTADISSVPQDAAAHGTPPVVRQNRWGSFVLVPLKKPTVIFSSDDMVTKGQMQLELTATPIM